LYFPIYQNIRVALSFWWSGVWGCRGRCLSLSKQACARGEGRGGTRGGARGVVEKLRENKHKHTHIHTHSHTHTNTHSGGCWINMVVLDGSLGSHLQIVSDVKFVTHACICRSCSIYTSWFFHSSWRICSLWFIHSSGRLQKSWLVNTVWLMWRLLVSAV